MRGLAMLPGGRLSGARHLQAGGGPGLEPCSPWALAGTPRPPCRGGSPPGCRGAWRRGSRPRAPHSLASPLFPCSHLNATELGAASFWLRVALGAAVTALVGFTLYRALAKNK